MARIDDSGSGDADTVERRDFPEWHDGKWEEVYWTGNRTRRIFERLKPDGYSAILNHYHLKAEDIAMERLETTSPRQLRELSDQKTEERIRLLAYDLWNQRGRPSGDDLADWIEAQKRIGMM